MTWPYTMTPPTDQTLYRTRPFTEFWVVSIEHLRRVWHADRGRLLLRTPGPVPLGLAYVLLVETYPFPNLSLFYRTMLFEYPSVLSRFCFIAPHVTLSFSFRRRIGELVPLVVYIYYLFIEIQALQGLCCMFAYDQQQIKPLYLYLYLKDPSNKPLAHSHQI